MFEVGKSYSFKMIIDSDETSFGGTIEFYEHPLIKLADTVIPEHLRPSRVPGVTVDAEHVIRGQIINVTSPYFISAGPR